LVLEVFIYPILMSLASFVVIYFIVAINTYNKIISNYLSNIKEAIT